MDHRLRQPQQKYVIINCESHDNLIKIEKEIFKMRIKQEITIPPLRDFNFYFLEKQLTKIVKTS